MRGHSGGTIGERPAIPSAPYSSPSVAVLPLRRTLTVLTEIPVQQVHPRKRLPPSIRPTAPPGMGMAPLNTPMLRRNSDRRSKTSRTTRKILHFYRAISLPDASGSPVRPISFFRRILHSMRRIQAPTASMLMARMRFRVPSRFTRRYGSRVSQRSFSAWMRRAAAG